jgi:ATP-binding protein involved in chromosome partitioning
MALNEQTLTAALQTVIDPNTGKDFVSTKALKNLQINGGDVSFDVVLGYPAKSQIAGFRKELIAAAKGVAGVDNVSANITRHAQLVSTLGSLVTRKIAMLPHSQVSGAEVL